MPRLDDAQRRARLSIRHHLHRPAANCVEVAASVVGLHSSDPVTVFLGTRARAPHVTPDEIEHALYEQRSLARILGMRRTMFVVPTETAPVVQAGAARGLVAAQRTRTVRMLEEAGLTRRGDRFLDRCSQDVLDALREMGPSTALALSKRVPDLALQMEVHRDGRPQGRTGVSTRVLFLLAVEGRIVRARPKGGWTSTQYRWALAEEWLGTDLHSWETAPAQAELARLWLRAFGPGSREDMRWWTGWTVRETTRALDAVGAIEVALNAGSGYVLPDDLDPVEPPPPRVAFLPALDPTVMGWKGRDWYLSHREALFDRNGNAGPTIWWDGRVVGGWAQRADGQVVWRLLEDVGRSAHRAVAEEASALRDWLGDVRFVPRFRTPLERELSSG
ncbi:MAG TPA: winged helix DNA-binding domain-containing protein [Actinomycetota bacterium]|nr:winged helix DNA-binding domain-containing protein [Actinomycetota bacterium]